MRLKIVYILLIVSGFCAAQDLPDYPERNFQKQLDSLQAPTEFYSVGATEGSINAAEYYVGPGDKVFISISGVREFVYNLSINQEGWMYVPQIGGVDLNNLTLEQAKMKLTESVNRYYKDVNIFISLVDFRIIRVSLIGDVVMPSNFVLTANSRLMDLISLSAGLNKTANIRNIEIISGKDSLEYYDLLSFLRFGDYSQNPYLREGDVILVDRADETVTISGLVKYPGNYEYVGSESVYDLIQLAGGFLSKAKTDTIEVVKFYDNGKNQRSEYYSINQLQKREVLLHNKDHVIIREIPEYLIEHFVRIEGYVRYPGYYKITKDKTTLKQIIENAGGFLQEAYLTEATLTRSVSKEKLDPEFERLRLMLRADMTDDEYDYFKTRSRERSGKVVVDFIKLFEEGDDEQNVFLKRGDVIKIPEKKNYITMLGQLVKPGNIIYDPSLSVDEYIELAGGFGWRAIEGDVRVIKANTGEWIDADEVTSLVPGDTIWVPEEPPGPKFWDVVMNGLQIFAQLAAIIAVVVVISTK
jgi:protein involved in polysaccharide export with SLBB domain